MASLDEELLAARQRLRALQEAAVAAQRDLAVARRATERVQAIADAWQAAARVREPEAVGPDAPATSAAVAAERRIAELEAALAQAEAAAGGPLLGDDAAARAKAVAAFDPDDPGAVRGLAEALASGHPGARRAAHEVLLAQAQAPLAPLAAAALRHAASTGDVELLDALGPQRALDVAVFARLDGPAAGHLLAWLAGRASGWSVEERGAALERALVRLPAGEAGTYSALGLRMAARLDPAVAAARVGRDWSAARHDAIEAVEIFARAPDVDPPAGLDRAALRCLLADDVTLRQAGAAVARRLLGPTFEIDPLADRTVREREVAAWLGFLGP